MKPITAQEKRVLELVSYGYSSVEIANTLGVSAHTVESHRKSLLNKMEAKNTAELMRKAFQLRVLGIPAEAMVNHISYGAI